MKISLNLLKHYLKISIEASRLCEILTNLGMAVDNVVTAEHDTILDVEITVNRADCLSHIGIARELAAYLIKPLHTQVSSMKEGPRPIESFVDVEIQAPDLCNRYCGRMVLGVKIQESPDWLKNFIISIGLRPVNNVVDIANYVMYDLGQPLHTFDYDKIGKQKIIVRRARNNEKIIAIDNKSYDLTDEMLIIADADNPVALAGIIGGKDSEIGETTKNIFLEGAFFDPASIRSTSRKLGLNTDASYRFERMTDINVLPLALHKVAQMIAELGQGEIAKGLIDVYPVFHKEKKIRFRPARVEFLLGEKIPYPWIQELLKRLGFEILDMSEHFWLVGVPSYRVDSGREIELIEMIARHFGFGKINSTLPFVNKKTIPDYDNFKLENYLRKVLVSSGFNEVISYSFLSEATIALFAEENKHALPLKNPISEENNVLRPNLAASMSLIAQYNMQHDISALKMFEIGKVFWHDAAHNEEERLGMVLVASEGKNKWDYGAGNDDIFYFKGVIEEVLKPWSVEWEYTGNKLPYLHPELQCGLKIDGQMIGYLGILSVQVMQKLELQKQLMVMELTIDKLAQLPSREMKYTPFTLHPMVERSISFLIDTTIKFKEIMDTLMTIKDDRIKGFRLVDVYKGSSLPEGKISYTVGVELQHPAKTLSSDEANEVLNYITSEIIEKLKATLR